MSGKPRSEAYYRIDNVLIEQELEAILDFVEFGMSILEKVVKRNLSPRAFDIDTMWGFDYDNCTIRFRSNKLARKVDKFLEQDLRIVFELAEKAWRFNLDIHELVSYAHFGVSYNRNYTYKLDLSNKWHWYCFGFRCEKAPAKKKPLLSEKFLADNIKKKKKSVLDEIFHDKKLQRQIDSLLDDDSLWD